MRREEIYFPIRSVDPCPGFNPIVAAERACLRVLFSLIKSTIFNLNSSESSGWRLWFLFFSLSSIVRFRSLMLLLRSLNVSLNTSICPFSVLKSLHFSSLLLSFSDILDSFASREARALVWAASTAVLELFWLPAEVKSYRADGERERV